MRAVASVASRMRARVLAARGVEIEREVAFGAVRRLLEPVFRSASRSESARLFSGSATPARRLFTADNASFSLSVDQSFAMLNALYWLRARLADAQPLVLMI